MKLSLEKIRNLGLKEESYITDYDDITIEFELPNEAVLSSMTLCSGEPCDVDSLEGFDGYLYIETLEELTELVGMTYEEVCRKIKADDDTFDLEEYL